MTDEMRRLLRECAVDLIRAADLSDDAALYRVQLVMRELDDVRAGLDLGLLHAQVFHSRLVA